MIEENRAQFMEEYLSDAVFSYCKNDHEYEDLSAQNRTIKADNPTLADIVDNATPHALTAEECALLINILKNETNRIFIEYRACYLRGLLDGIEGKSRFEIKK